MRVLLKAFSLLFNDFTYTKFNMEKKSIFDEVPDMKYSELAPKIDPIEFVKVIESRRSVRVYDDIRIPEEIVNKCLDLALLAPNSSNLQAWEFHWVRSEEKKNALVEACLSQPAAKTAAELFVAVGRTGTWKKNAQIMLAELNKSEVKVPRSALSYYTRIVPLVYTMGPLGLIGLFKKLAFFFIGLFKVVPREPTSQSDMKIWASKSTALGCENLMLAFRAYGYDTCPMEGLDSTRVKKILNLPSDAIVVMVISAGKRAPNGIYGPRLRFERSQFIKEH